MSIKEKTKDLFGLKDDSEEEDVYSSDEEEQEDSRFTKSRLNKLSLGENEDDASSDEDDDSSDEDDDSSEEDDSSNEETDVKNKKKDRVEKEERHDQVEKEEGDVDNESEKKQKKKANKTEGDDTDTDELEDIDGFDLPKDLLKRKKNKLNPSLSKKQLKTLEPEVIEQFEKAKKRTGVCYLSRIPLFMQPKQVRSALNKYAAVGRIFLVPEDPKATARRKKYQKNRRTNFIEGWVEFMDKKKAKALAEHLNMKQIGGKRTNEFYAETWNIKYLPKFKWSHLGEHMAHEKQARKQRLRNEIAQANRENKTYIQNVEKSKMVQKMEQKKRKREGTNTDDKKNTKIQRTFPQRTKVVREVHVNNFGPDSMKSLDKNLQNLLGNIFSKKN